MKVVPDYSGARTGGETMLGQLIAECIQMGMRGQELANCILEMIAKF